MPDTLAAHLDAARRCEKAGLQNYREYHLQQVLRFDPNHEDARHSLGYSRVDGEWFRADDFMRSKGYVRHNGVWRLPQEVALREAADAEEEASVEWRKKIKMWRDWVIKGRDRASDGHAEILHIRDPLAVSALIESLTRDNEPPALRLLYLEPLGEIGGGSVLATFVSLVLHDPQADVREACLDRLAKSGSKAAVRQFIKALKHPENLIVRRAAAALERMNDTEATLPLIEALITEHKKIIGGGQMSAGFSNTGMQGLTMGGRPKPIVILFENEPVLRALTTMHVGVNFGFDKKRWKDWFIDQNRPKTIVSLRRSP
jgi:hypothetical protein